MSYGTLNLGGRLYISTTAVNFDLDESGFVSLTYELVSNVINHGDTGFNQAARSFAVFGRDIRFKTKEVAEALDSPIELLQRSSAGMALMEVAAAPGNLDNYAFSIVWADGSVEYNRGMVMGRRLLKGGNEDFKRVAYTLSLQQASISIGDPPPSSSEIYLLEGVLAVS